MTARELAKLDPMVSVYRSRSMLEQGLREKHAQVREFSLRQALRLIEEACAIQEAKDKLCHERGKRR